MTIFVKIDLMNAKMISLSVLLGMFAFLPDLLAQCEIKNRIYPDGSMMYYIAPVNFYFTKSKSLRGGITTDKENYYLELLPVPFPEKPAGNKLKENLDLRLSDGKWYTLQHYDTRYTRNDTALKMIFLIDKEVMDQFLSLDVTDVKINMMDSAGIRAYVFKLHKSALREQLECFLSEDEKTKEK
jgi:hypothetical protein